MEARSDGTGEVRLGRESAVFVWTDRALFVGGRSETSLHSHHAIELCIALDDRGIDMTSPDGTELSAVPGAIVRAGAPHRLAIPGPKVAVLYLDPQSEIAASLDDWLGEHDLRRLSDDLMHVRRRAFAALLESPGAGLPEAEAACSALIGSFADEAPRPKMHWRVRRAMTELDAHLDAPPSLDELAERIGISTSRLRHMFKEQAGLPIRRYVLWMRLRAALLEALEGASMTASAQAAGFADAAHFTRTCKQMFGLPPSAFAPVDTVFVA
ncbi:MAG: helix-turn-helix domain-containing protein [Polyangiales bacterium]